MSIKRREKKRDYADFPNSKSVYEQLKNEYDISSDDLVKFYKIKQFFEKLKDLDPELIKRFEEKGIRIPVSIFRRELGSLETIVKYLKENLSLKIKDIAKLTKRDKQTIYKAYSFARKKYPKKFEVEYSRYYFPISILHDRKLGV